MSPHANTIATWGSIIALVLGGGIWVGSIASETASNKQTTTEVAAQVDKLRDAVPPAVAELRAQMSALQRDADEIKRMNQEILAELRKKK